jgi:hypothetical protein
MPCLAITSGHTYTGCKDNISGIDEIIVTEYNNLDQTNVLKFATTANVVTTLVLATGKQGWKYDLGKEMINVSDNSTVSAESDTVFYTPQITFTTKGFTTLTKVNLDTLSRHRLLIFVKRRNGTWWLAGLDGGMDATTIENPFGQKYEDFSGHIANFSGKSESPMIEVTASLITALLSPAL